LNTYTQEADLAVVGGGMAGLLAALAAARNGAKVVLMHDRPVLGGNASSECRVHICGADRHNHIAHMRETGILEELRLENLYRNPQRSFSVWDTLLYEKALAEPNLHLLLNCSCLNASIADELIQSITGWQLTTQTYHEVRARLFADCSGDAILAPLTGALHRMGRESRKEFGEAIAPEIGDDKTMGMTCLFQAKDCGSPQGFEPPSWAHTFESCDDLPYGENGHRWFEMGYWWVELGGEHHSIHDTEILRDELLRIVYGIWDHLKNRCPHKEEVANWALDWVQFLPAKRESRRYVGEHVLCQGDIESEGHFEDIVAYGGWSMDDHHPAGFGAVRVGCPATIFHKAPSPYGIPYRSLYSRNIRNLFFAGRDASCTHAAMSSTRVMGTGCSMGQAVGTAASLCTSKGIEPRSLLEHIGELQQRLLGDDAYLPWIPYRPSSLSAEAVLEASQGDPEPVRDGVHRTVGEDAHAWTCRPGDWIAYRFGSPQSVRRVHLVLDSGLDQLISMSYLQRDDQRTTLPDCLPSRFRVELLREGQWDPGITVQQNRQRLIKIEIGKKAEGIRFVLEELWGKDPTLTSLLHAFLIEQHE